MHEYIKHIVVSMVVIIFLWSTSAYALGLLHEKQGKAYYKADDGTTIVHDINPNATKPSFLYQSADKRMMYYRMPNGDILVGMRMGALSNVPEYDWRNGCSPTSAGMMMGYYDLNGYDGLYYQKLVPRGPAELSTFVTSSQRANKAIASSQHISDYYTGEGNNGDDPCDGDLDTCHGGGNCLADFMGTSQDMYWLFPACNGALGSAPVHTDGETLFW